MSNSCHYDVPVQRLAEKLHAELKSWAGEDKDLRFPRICIKTREQSARIEIEEQYEKHRDGADIVSLDDLGERGFVMQYPAPHKDNSEVSERWVVNWPTFNRTPPSEESVRKSFEKLEKIVDERVEIKRTNTIAFLNFSAQNRKCRND